MVRVEFYRDGQTEGRTDGQTDSVIYVFPPTVQDDTASVSHYSIIPIGTNRRTVFSGIKQPMNIYSLETQSGVGACSVSPCRDGICLAVNETDYQCYCDRYVTPDPTTGSCGK
eukprot:sb/3476997/